MAKGDGIGEAEEAALSAANVGRAGQLDGVRLADDYGVEE